MSPKYILLEDVEHLGLAGDTVNVASGYARNYLIPKGLIAKVSPAALRRIEANKMKIEARRKKEIEDAQELAVKLAEIEITIPMQADDNNQLFGSVTSHVIAEELADQGIEVEQHRIKLENPIKELGVFNVDVKLHGGTTATLKVWVVRA